MWYYCNSMPRACPRCRARDPRQPRFCANCGMHIRPAYADWTSPNFWIVLVVAYFVLHHLRLF